MEDAPSNINNEEQQPEIVPTETNDPEIEEILDAVPEEKREDVLHSITVLEERYVGPIPHPRLVAGWEQVLPGSADRILKMAEQQQSHRIEMEKQAVGSQLKSNNRGQLFGFILSTLVLIAGIVLLVLGMPWFGIALIGFIVAILAILFISGKIHMDADLKNKKGSIDAQPKDS